MRLIIHSAAEEEFVSALRYSDSQSNELGGRFSDECAAVIERILEAPASHRRIAEGTHQIRLRRFPYSILYQPDENAVLIVAFAHDRRRPGYWHSRLPD